MPNTTVGDHSAVLIVAIAVTGGVHTQRIAFPTEPAHVPSHQTRAGGIEESFGWSIATFNPQRSDERTRILIGAPDAHCLPTIDPTSGHLEAVSGAIYVASLNPGTIERTLSFSRGTRCGYSLTVARVNPSGHSPVFVGAPGNDDSKGLVFQLTPESLMVEREFTAGMPGDSFGYAVSADADLNGDGWSELVVGAPTAGGRIGRGGRAYVYDGRSGHLLREIESPAAAPLFGTVILNVHDVDHAGTADFVIASPGVPVSAESRVAANSLVAISGETGQTLVGVVPYSPDALTGVDLCAVADGDGDGHPDVLVASITNKAQRLTCYLRVYMSATWVGGTIAPIELGYAAEDCSSDRVDAAHSVNVVELEDIDGGGMRDFMVGCPAGFYKGYYSGFVAMVSRENMAVLRRIGPSTEGTLVPQGFGAALAPTGDIDRDGRSDLVVGTSDNGLTSGFVEVLSGATWSAVDRLWADR